MSKLNPQKASAYVGPGVLRKGGKITPVPNGPLIKKKGPYAGSTLKSGGKIKKAQDGFNKIKPGTKQTTPKYHVPESRFVITNDTAKVKPTRWINNPMPPSKDKKEFPMPSEALMDSVSKASVRNIDTSKLMKKKAQTGAAMTKRDSLVANIKEQSRLRQNLVDFRKKVGNKRLTPELIREKDSLNGLLSDFGTKQRMKATGLTEQQLAKGDSIYTEQQRRKRTVEDDSGQLRGMGNDKPGCSGSQRGSERRVRREARRKNGGPIKKAQGGSLIKKAIKKTTKEIIPVAEKNLTRVDAAYNKKGLNMAIERRLNPEAAKKKMTKAQRRSFEVDDSYRRNGGPVKKAKAGAMIKRADGSFSKRGLWDNIRANKGSGKKPTKQMLVQEKKIKAKTKK